MRYAHTSRQREAVLRMMKSRRFVLAGPLEPEQGRSGLINRLPIFLPPANG